MKISNWKIIVCSIYSVYYSVYIIHWDTSSQWPHWHFRKMILTNCFVAESASFMVILLNSTFPSPISSHFASSFYLLLKTSSKIKWFFISPPHIEPQSGKWMVEAFLGERGEWLIVWGVLGRGEGDQGSIALSEKVLMKHQSFCGGRAGWLIVWGVWVGMWRPEVNSPEEKYIFSKWSKFAHPLIQTNPAGVKS